MNPKDPADLVREVKSMTREQQDALVLRQAVRILVRRKYDAGSTLSFLTMAADSLDPR